MLQWGHDRAVVELRDQFMLALNDQLLQWGHDRAVVELPGIRQHLFKRFLLQWGHDRAVVELVLTRRLLLMLLGFNGATTARSWN